jgi:hypothetical protein
MSRRCQIEGDWLPWALAHEREGQRHAARGMVPASGHGMSLGGHGGHGGPWAMARRVASFTWWIRMTSRSWRTGVVLGILFSISFQIRGFKFVRARPRSSFQTLPDVWKRMWRSISTSSSRTEPGPLHKGFPQSFASASLARWRQRETESFAFLHPCTTYASLNLRICWNSTLQFSSRATRATSAQLALKSSLSGS